MAAAHGQEILAEDVPTTGQKFAAEVLGTFVLVFFGCGAAIMSGLTSGDMTGYITTGLTFGLTVVVMAYAVGRVSGGHFNPAVTLGAALGGRLPWRLVGVYVAAQLLGGLLAGLLLWGLLHGFEGFTGTGNMAQNSFGDAGSGFAWWAAFLLEVVTTFVFLTVILAVTDDRNENVAALAPLAIGLALAMIHFASMAATGTSVNPARSIGVGVFAGSDAVVQLWLFVLAPLGGATLAGLLYPLAFGGAAPVPGSGISRGRGQAPMPPVGYEQQWNQGSVPQGWGQGAGQSWGQAPPPAAPPAGQPGGQSWGQPPQQWGQPGYDDGEDGRTQIRRPD